MITQSIVSYPSRGHWGDWRYRGNCSGFLIKDLIETYHPSSILDPMHGGGTTGEVAAEYDIPFFGYDLHDGYDILDARTQAKMRRDVNTLPTGGADMIFFHPPYWNMITYSRGNPLDFANGPYSLYLLRMQNALVHLSNCLSRNGFIALLLGDLRLQSHNQTYFLTDDVTENRKVASAKLIKELRIIKVQHNTQSKGETNLGIKLTHEYVTILRSSNALRSITPRIDALDETPEADGDTNA
jgi:hypothetical protein